MAGGYVLYCDASDRVRLSPERSKMDGVRFCSDWAEWVRLLPDAEVAGAVVRHQEESVLRRLQAIRERYPRLPLVLIVPSDAELVRWLVPASPAAVLWIENARHELPTTLARLSAQSALRAAVSTFLDCQWLPPTLVQALQAACESEPSLRRVKMLAARVGCPESTLRAQWRRANRRDAERRMEDMLSWVLLLRAVRLHRADHSWVDAAGRLHVHEHTLDRAARRLLDRSLADLARGGQPVLGERFRAWLAPMLVPPVAKLDREKGLSAREASDSAVK